MNDNELKTNDIEEVKAFYEGRYKKLFSYFKKKFANKKVTYIVDKQCGHWLELHVYYEDYIIFTNVGINNKYNIVIRSKNSWIGFNERDAFSSQKGAIDFIERKFGCYIN